MRVHSLSVTAFGPFAATVKVDLDALSRDGLFLLCGPTGAGKTSLLDAIAFALYGRVPGARGQEKRLRSDHASAAVRTEVGCEMTLRGERVRITRRPEQVRPKARGNGTTKDQALLHVQRQVAGVWEPVSTRLDEGGDYLRDQVGLTPEQFWQVVLLPQGEFAEFLRAEPDQRAKVLETLFDARRFADVEIWLADHARAMAASRASAEDVVDRLVHRIEQAARGLRASGPAAAAPTVPAMPAIEDPSLVRAYVTRQLRRATDHVAVTGREDAVTRERLLAAECGRDQGRRAVRAADRLLAVCQQRDALRRRSRNLADQRARLAAALAAEPLRPLLDADTEADELVRRAATALTGAHADLACLDVGGLSSVWLELADRPNLVSAGAAPETELRRWSRALRAEVSRLADLEAELAPLEDDERALAQLIDEQAQRSAAMAELEAIGKQLPAALAALEVRRDAARVAAAGLEHYGGALTTAHARVQAASRAAELTKLISAAHAEQVASERACLTAKAKWLSLREVRLAGIAAELAGRLADGQSCPVCGSAQHPAPAAPTEVVVTAADERAAADRHTRLESAAQQLGEHVAELRREFEVCLAVTDGAKLTDLRAELNKVTSDEAAARAAAEHLPLLIAEHADLLNGGEELTVQMQALAEAAAADRATAKGLSNSVVARQRRVDKARGEDDSLADRRLRLARLADACEALELASTALAAAAAGQARIRAKLGEALQHNGFAETVAAHAALLDQPVRDELTAEIRSYEDSDIGIAAEFDSATTEFDSAAKDLLGLVDVSSRDRDVADVRRLLEQARQARACLDQEFAAAGQARDHAVAAISRAAGILSQITELQVLTDQALTECVPLREASESAAALAALVAGGGANVKKMRLRSYVLAARLEQVASAATARLRQMSSGRYGFVHSDDLRGGNRRSGLSVDILDSHTGTQRPTKTLSGGESFMAALALALGLADVVTAESGGISLDTLFVDEGFGSLDPEALDAVMTVLDDLRQGGRVVGIVSHVEELRTRVPMQLQIQTTSHGSTLDQSDASGGEPSALAG